MSIYSVKGKGWRYDFTLKGIRHTEAWFKTKTEAKKEEAQKRKEALNPAPQVQAQTDMDFLELVNRRLDYVQAYNSKSHYTDLVYEFKRWLRELGSLKCSQISVEKIEKKLLKRKKMTSAYTANKSLRNIRALFNFGMHPKRKWIQDNPTEGIEFFPVEKRIKYVPPKEDVFRVILAADRDTKDYLWTIMFTMGRMSEINRLTWQDVNLKERYIILYTRKKRGGHFTPRKIPMADKLLDAISNRFLNRDKSKPWVFWHRYWSRNAQEWVEGPYIERKKIMKTLCTKAGVKYFRYHALRHCGASLLDQANVPIGSIQRILGHENRTTTEIYLHSVGNAERDAIEVLDFQFEEKSHTDSHTEAKKISSKS